MRGNKNAFGDCSMCVKWCMQCPLAIHPLYTMSNRQANAALGFVRRNVITSSEIIKVTAYEQLLRPLMEYASVQRRAARLICNILRTDHQTSTTSLLTKLNLDDLSSRQANARLWVFKQYHFSENIVILSHLQRTLAPSVRRHCHQYLIPHSNTLHHQRSFFVKTAKE